MKSVIRFLPGRNVSQAIYGLRVGTHRIFSDINR